MGRRVAGARLLAPLVVVPTLLVAGCGPKPVEPETEQQTSEPAVSNVTEHESGPQSPIAYGFQVPIGASQIGPLVRYRSDRLIHAYQAELEAAQARKDANQQRREDEAAARQSPIPQPAETATAAPTTDTFKLLQDPPKPDITISLMRMNGSPTKVLQRMLAQIDVILPKAGIVRTNIGKYCASKYHRVTSCHLSVQGASHNKRKLAVTLDVDPGDLETRTSPPATNKHPVMALRVEYVGDPRAGQENRQHDSDVDVPTTVRHRDRSGLIWPSMDMDARRSSALLNDWHSPLGADLLLSSFHPAFVVLNTDRALDASSITEKFAKSIQAEPAVDVVEDLNETTTTYSATGPNGEHGLASYILTARGYYSVLFWYPAPVASPAPVAASPSAPIVN